MENKILISIPAKNEAKTLAKVISSSLFEVQKLTSVQPSVLVVDDGSIDDTSSIAKSCGAHVIKHRKSRGLGYVFSEAVEYAIEYKYDIMLTVDGDGQFSASDIPKLLEPILDNQADFVTGSRFLNGSSVIQIPTIKRIGNRAMSQIISSILGEKFKDVSCGFRAYNRNALTHLNVFGKFTYTQEVFLNLGIKQIRISEVPINVQYFKKRKSRIAHNIIKYALQTSAIIFKSLIIYRPMRLFGLLSALSFAIGAPIVTALSVRYYQTDLITPFKGIGITGIIFLILSFLSLVSGIILGFLSRIQLSIEQAIYYARKKS